MTDAGRIIHEMASHADADMRLCGAAYRIIAAEPAERQTDLFVQTLLEYRLTPTSGDWTLPEVCGKLDEIRSFVRMTSEYKALKEELNGVFTDADRFNAEMWRRISDEEKYPDPVDRSNLMEHCATDNLMPRIDAPDISVSGEEFSRLKKEIDHTTLLKLKDVTRRWGRRSAESAAYMLKLIDGCGSEAERLAVMSAILFSPLTGGGLMSLLERETEQSENDSSDD